MTAATDAKLPYLYKPHHLIEFNFPRQPPTPLGQINHNSGAAIEVINGLDVSLPHVCCWIEVQQGYDLYPHGIYRRYSTECKIVWIMEDALYLFGRNLEQSCGCDLYKIILYNPDGFLVITKAWNTRCMHVSKNQQQFILYTLTCVVCLMHMCYYIPNQ